MHKRYVSTCHLYVDVVYGPSVLVYSFSTTLHANVSYSSLSSPFFSLFSFFCNFHYKHSNTCCKQTTATALAPHPPSSPILFLKRLSRPARPPEHRRSTLATAFSQSAPTLQRSWRRTALSSLGPSPMPSRYACVV